MQVNDTTALYKSDKSEKKLRNAKDVDHQKGAIIFQALSSNKKKSNPPVSPPLFSQSPSSDKPKVRTPITTEQ